MNIFYKIVNLFIDMSIILWYTELMKYVSKKLNDSLNVSGIVNLHFFEFGKDFSTEDERHPFYELIFVNSGKMYVASEDYTGYLNKHEMIIHRSDTEHSLKCDADGVLAVIIIGFETDSDILDVFSKAPLLLSDNLIKKLAEIIKEGRNVFLPPFNTPVYDMKKRKHQMFGSEQLLRMLLEYFLISLVREYRFNENAEDDSNKTTAAISEVIEYVSGNCLEKITIDELSFLFRTNRSTLCREFKSVTGKSVIEYINQKKYEIAMKKIRETNDSFTKIAEEMKFDSIHYFTSFFKKMSGMTPSEFRKKVQRKS